ncbi:MAG TPA: DUF3592 domain-containing protein [Acidobacteriaceae bacterium]|jgi:hypothetical protein|nr:DUF3592 domain-containing protein [Acidobacteriaceae bacterium]
MNEILKEILRHLAPFAGAFHSLIALAAGAGAVLLRNWWQRVRENRAAMWPSAPGEVQGATVKKSQQGSWVQVSYRYYARGEYRYGQYRRHFRRKAAAEAFAEAIRGRSLQVRFQEDKPGESVLLERDLQMSGMVQMG